MRTVSVLCADSRSVYRGMEGVEVYGKRRDARTFGGGTPIIAHPPCRAWSAFCAHQAQPEPGEKELGLWCCEQLRACGGVLEQPAHSRLFGAAGLPLPGKMTGALWTAAVLQSWWADGQRKATWLCFSMIPRDSVEFPFRLRLDRDEYREWQLMSKRQRAATSPALAQWLVDVARTVSVQGA